MPQSEERPRRSRGERQDDGRGEDRGRETRRTTSTSRGAARPERAPARRGGDRRPATPERQPPGREATAQRGTEVEGPRRPRRRAPTLPDDITPADLAPEVRRELRSLPAALADAIAAHLVAAGRLLDEDPRSALRHADYAKSLAPRLAVLREAHGIAAYHAEDYATALAELRAVRRMTGAPDHLPVMADCERGLGRPARALSLASDPDVRRLDMAAQVEMRIVASGARRDLGEADAAAVTLQGPALDSPTLQPWSARLWYAYAEALLAAGRREEAAEWFRAVVSIDDEGETDAEERLEELGG